MGIATARPDLLALLGDVEFTNLQDDDEIFFDLADNKWKNRPSGGGGGGGASALIDLTDVTGTPGTGKAPVSDGAGEFPLTDVATQAELAAEIASRASGDTAAQAAAEATAAAALAAHLGDASDAHDASAISILDTAADFTATDVEGALAELQTADEADEAALAAHLADGSDAHDASAISSVPAGGLAATNVQAALNELDTEKLATASALTFAQVLAQLIADGDEVSVVQVPDTVAGLGTINALEFATTGPVSGLAFKRAADTYPCLLITVGGDGGVGFVMGDGTVDPWNNGAYTSVFSNGDGTYAAYFGTSNNVLYVPKLDAMAGYFAKFTIPVQLSGGSTGGGGGTAGAIISSEPGVPSLGGNVGDIYVRSTDAPSVAALIYRCTVAGIAGAATWVSLFGTAAALASDTDGTLAANSDSRAATQKAVKTYVDASFAANDAMIFKGVIDCSSNPNYPAADRGHTYKVSVAGKIGGASGTNVEVGDTLICITDGTAAGTQAAVGANWTIVQANLDGAVIGPASAVSGQLASFSGTGGKVIQDSGLALDTDDTLAANSDAKIASQKAVKTYTLAQLAAEVTARNSAILATKLDDFTAPDDNTDLDASTSKHGLMKKYPGGTTTFLRADGTFAAPAAAIATKDSPVWTPAYQNMLAATYDPGLCTGQVVHTSGAVHVFRVLIPTDVSVTNILGILAIVGSGLNANQCFAAIFNSTGATRIGITADQASAWASGTGLKTMAIVGGPVVATAPWIYIAFLHTRTAGASPSWRQWIGAGAQVNVGLASGTERSATNVTGQTSMPSSLTLTSNTPDTNMCWAGLS